MCEDHYLCLLSSFIEFGPKRIELLTRYFGSANAVWTVSNKELENVGLTTRLVNLFDNFRKRTNPDTFFKSLADRKIGFLTKNNSLYPDLLKDIEDSPVVIFYRGNCSILGSDGIAIVGSRKVTQYGREVTKRFSQELSNSGFNIISGLAFGVDYVAHRSTLDTDGTCIAVLASGLDDITPRSNKTLGEEIIKSGGVIISEYPPKTTPKRQFFPFRNRIISGLSRAVIVVEGRLKSGTLHTAKAAANQGRPVFAIPGQIYSPNSEAPHYLIQNGSHIAFSHLDILSELGRDNLQIKINTAVLPQDDLEENICNILENEELSIDELARISNVEVSVISAKLTFMEMKGMVKNIGTQKYKRI